MTQNIYDRAMVREQTIWPSFLYTLPNTSIEITKDIVFGLYANSYLLGHNYLEDIEAEELQRLLDTYESSMAELDMEEQNLVLEIASKRYIKAIEIQIKNDKIATKYQELSADEEEYEAKLASFDADRAAIVTKQNQVQLAIDRATLKNKELISRIELETLAQQYVEVDISKKQLDVSRAELSILLAAIKGLGIQLEITNTGYRIVELDSTKAGIKVGTAMAQVQTEENKFTSSNDGSLSGDKLFAEEEDLRMMEYEINGDETDSINSKRIELIEKHEARIESEKDFYVDTLIPEEVLLETEQTSKRQAQHDATVQGYSDRKTIAEDAKDQLELMEDFKSDREDDEKEHRTSMIEVDDKVYFKRMLLAGDKKTAAVSAAETIAAADITTTLTHEIGGI